MASSSSHLNWLIVRDQNAFLIKRRNIRKPFSKVNFNPQSALTLLALYDDFLYHPRSLSYIMKRT